MLINASAPAILYVVIRSELVGISIPDILVLLLVRRVVQFLGHQIALDILLSLLNVFVLTGIRPVVSLAFAIEFSVLPVSGLR